jgi:hypothetical protein
MLGAVGKKPHTKLLSGTKFNNKASLMRAARPGDMIFAGAPWGISKQQNINKATISAIMGNPSGYHPLLVEKVNKNGTATVLELSSNKGFQRSTYGNSPDNYTLLRSKTNVAPAVKRMGKIVDVNDKLDRLLRQRGLTEKQVLQVRQSAHAGGGRKALATAGKELFIPNVFKKSRVGVGTFDTSVVDFEKNLTQHANSIASSIKKTGKLPRKNPLSCLGGMCTSPLARSGMPIGEKSGLKFVGPNDFLRSKSYEVIGHSPSKTPKFMGRAANQLLKAGPGGFRLGAGLVLGGAAYSLLKNRGKK